MLFEFSYSQDIFFPELYNWIILTAWAAVLLILGAVAFSLLGISRTRNMWWQYFALVLIGGLGFWSLVIAYNSYHEWLQLKASLQAVLPQHGVTNAYLTHAFGQTYYAAIQTSQLQFALITSALVILLCIAGWQFRRTFTKKAAQTQLMGKYQWGYWKSLFIFTTGLICLLLSIFLIIVFFQPLIRAPQMIPFQFDEPIALELVGFLTVSLGGPLILLLLSAASYRKRRTVAAQEHVAV